MKALALTVAVASNWTAFPTVTFDGTPIKARLCTSAGYLLDTITEAFDELKLSNISTN
jgi:hypothetical protein